MRRQGWKFKYTCYIQSGPTWLFQKIAVYFLEGFINWSMRGYLFSGYADQNIGLVDKRVFAVWNPDTRAEIRNVFVIFDFLGPVCVTRVPKK